MPFQCFVGTILLPSQLQSVPVMESGSTDSQSLALKYFILCYNIPETVCLRKKERKEEGKKGRKEERTIMIKSLGNLKSTQMKETIKK